MVHIICKQEHTITNIILTYVTLKLLVVDLSKHRVLIENQIAA